MSTKKQNKVNNVLRAENNAELLSYIINQTPELSAEIDLPVQGQDIRPIGKIIVSNERFKNAFINTINLIGLTVIERNAWENPWEDFTSRGTISFGQTVRELMVDIANVYDYNETANNPTNFLQNVVPNVYNYLHEINYQKYYKTTTSDDQIAMAFNTENGLFDLIETIIGSLYEAYKYDKYIVDKYQLQRRILDGTMTSKQIANFETLSPRQRVSAMKSESNKMTFRSPNYNPSGIRTATSFDDQIMIMNTDFEAEMSTEVLATSFFRNDAEMKTRLALIDGFGSYDEARLTELLGDAFVPFDEDEKTALSKIPAVIISKRWFQDYDYLLNIDADTSKGEFYNPETRKNNHWLHTWKVISTSPFENAIVFTTDAPTVNTVTVAPQETSITAGMPVQLGVTVDTTGFANKAVTWSLINSDNANDGKASVDLNGKVTIAKDYDTTKGSPQITVTATSVYDTTKSGQATITVL